MRRYACWLACLFAWPSFGATLDNFSDSRAWTAEGSDGVQASLQPVDGTAHALRLNYDFGNVSGYAAIKRSLPIEFPENYQISFRVRGSGATNDLQLKFIDESGDNVWWYPRRNFSPTSNWQTIRIKKRHVDLAWGPTHDRVLRQTAKVEFTISAASGGRGYLEFEQLELTALPPERDDPIRFTASASSNTAAASTAVDGNTKTAWLSAGNKSEQALTLDMGKPREFGGVEIDWLPEHQASRYLIQLSDNGREWRTVRSVTEGNGGRDAHFLAESEASQVRIVMQAGPSSKFGIAEVRLKDLAFGVNTNAFFQSIAQTEPRGWYPRSISGEQSYWTLVGINGGVEQSLLGEEGTIEASKGSFSVEPFIKLDDAVLTWADVKTEQSLLDGYLPIPRVTWHHPKVQLDVEAVAKGRGSDSSVVTQYRVKNTTKVSQRGALVLGIRPFQVNPSAQFLGRPGGVSEIKRVALHNDVVEINEVAGIRLITPADQFGAAPFDAGSVVEWLQLGSIPKHQDVIDDTGFASGALLYGFELDAGESKTIAIELPQVPNATTANSPFADIVKGMQREWAATLNQVEFNVPAEATDLIDTLRTAHAHVLVNRDGPALQPGARSYSRSWIRDGAMMADALFRLGDPQPAKDYVRWYAAHLFANGKIPCCVDKRGADPVPENDSPGEFVFLVANIHRYTRDETLLKELWPQVKTAMAFMEKMRLSERTPQILQSKQRAFYGLLPVSISHEGYSAKPMHSYWDDFWGLKGYDAAVYVASALHEVKAADEYRRAHAEFRIDVRNSIEQAMRDRNVRYIPGCAELGDFDPTSTSIALAPAGDRSVLPETAVQVSYERYWSEFLARQRSSTWDAYTPYELRNVSTFIQLGWRERASELLKFFMAGRRPASWNQWAEVIGRDARQPRFTGDMPHGWIASDYIRAVLDMFAYERSDDKSLVLMAGIPTSWLQSGFGVTHLQTPYGELSYSVKSEHGNVELNIDTMQLPIGGLRIDWPTDLSAEKIKVLKGQTQWRDGHLYVSKLPLLLRISD